MKEGDTVSACSFTATPDVHTDFAAYRGKWVVLYFYPKDATPGCTTEGQNFRDKYPDFLNLNAVVLGVSKDSIKSHQNFKEKQLFPFELISDIDEKLCEQFTVMKMKSMYGRQYRGIERSTFLIDPLGKIRHVWRGVKVKNHVDDVLNTLRDLTKF